MFTFEEANKCWDYGINDVHDLTLPDVALKEIIDDNELSIEQKVYLTWIYTSTLEKRKELKKITR